MSFAKGTYAFGNCDYCASRWPLSDLKNEVVNGMRTGTKACPDCWSADHPQNHLGKLKIWDPQALLDPRPEVGIENEVALRVRLLAQLAEDPPMPLAWSNQYAVGLSSERLDELHGAVERRRRIEHARMREHSKSSAQRELR